MRYPVEAYYVQLKMIVLNVALDMMTLCSGVNVLQMGMKPFITNAKNVNVNGPRTDNLVRVNILKVLLLIKKCSLYYSRST